MDSLQTPDAEFRQTFPLGEKLPAQFSAYFIGQAYLAPLTHNAKLGVPMHNVTFEPGCRNNWHSHTGGQILVCTAGRGFYQERGKAARALRPGDVEEIAPDVVHWHGAAPDSWFSHIAVECHPETNKNTWYEPVDDVQYRAAVGDARSEAPAGAIRNAVAASFRSTDPELAEVFSNFADHEIADHVRLDARSRALVTLACLLARGAHATYATYLPEASRQGLTPLEIRETVYHAVPYVGMAVAAEFLKATNAFLQNQGVRLPLPDQSTTTAANREAKGLALQKSIFGASIDRMRASAPSDEQHLQRALAGNCFGDHQTRSVFSAADRELLTFAMLISLGGCEPQVKGHIAGNVAVGNDRARLLDVATVLLPYNGYPRTLNAVACIDAAAPLRGE